MTVFQFNVNVSKTTCWPSSMDSLREGMLVNVIDSTVCQFVSTHMYILYSTALGVSTHIESQRCRQEYLSLGGSEIYHKVLIFTTTQARNHCNRGRV